MISSRSLSHFSWVHKDCFSRAIRLHISSSVRKTVVLCCCPSLTSTLHSLCSQSPKCFVPTPARLAKIEQALKTLTRELPRQERWHRTKEDSAPEWAASEIYIHHKPNQSKSNDFQTLNPMPTATPKGRNGTFKYSIDILLQIRECNTKGNKFPNISLILA